MCDDCDCDCPPPTWTRLAFDAVMLRDEAERRTALRSLVCDVGFALARLGEYRFAPRVRYNQVARWWCEKVVGGHEFVAPKGPLAKPHCVWCGAVATVVVPTGGMVN